MHYYSLCEELTPFPFLSHREYKNMDDQLFDMFKDEHDGKVHMGKFMAVSIGPVVELGVSVELGVLVELGALLQLGVLVELGALLQLVELWNCLVVK